MPEAPTLQEKIFDIIKGSFGSGCTVMGQVYLDNHNAGLSSFEKQDYIIKVGKEYYGLKISQDGEITIASMDASGNKKGVVTVGKNGNVGTPRLDDSYATKSTHADLKQMGLKFVSELGYGQGIRASDAVEQKLAAKAEAGKVGDRALQNIWGEVLGPERVKAAAQNLQEMAADREKLGEWYDRLQREGRLGELKSYGIDFDNLNASADNAMARRAADIDKISYGLQKMAREIEQGGAPALAAVQARLAQGHVEAHAAATRVGAGVSAASADANNPFASLLEGHYVPPGSSGIAETHSIGATEVRGGGGAARFGRAAGIVIGPAIAAAAVLATGGGISDASAAAGAAVIGDTGMAVIEGKGAAEVARGAATDVAGYAGNVAGGAAGLFAANAAGMGVLGATTLATGGAVVGGVALAYAAGKAYDAYDNHQTREGLRERMMKLSNDDGYGLKNQALVELYEVAKAPGQFEKVWDEIKAEGGARYQAVMEYAASTDPDLINQYQDKLKGLVGKDPGDPAKQSPEVKSLMEVRANPELFAKQWQELVNIGVDMKDILVQLNAMIAENAEREREMSGDYLPENAATVRVNPGMNLPI